MGEILENQFEYSLLAGGMNNLRIWVKNINTDTDPCTFAKSIKKENDMHLQCLHCTSTSTASTTVAFDSVSLSVVRL